MGTGEAREVFIEERHKIAIAVDHVSRDRVGARTGRFGKHKPRGGRCGPPHIVKDDVVAHDQMVGLVGTDARTGAFRDRVFLDQNVFAVGGPWPHGNAIARIIRPGARTTFRPGVAPLALGSCGACCLFQTTATLGGAARAGCLSRGNSPPRAPLPFQRGLMARDTIVRPLDD